MEGRAAEVAAVSVRFVSRLAPDNCYGLYTGDGPAYCSGNRTVFVGTAAANRLMAKFGPQAEAGITFLIGHEIGHHIQNLNGRFYALSQAIYSSPDDGPDYVRRFELQADCLAGVWIHAALRGRRRTSSAPTCSPCSPTSATTSCSRVSRQRNFGASDCTGRPSSVRAGSCAARKPATPRHATRSACRSPSTCRLSIESQKALPRYWLTSQATPFSVIVLHIALASATVSSGPATSP